MERTSRTLPSETVKAAAWLAVARAPIYLLAACCWYFVDRHFREPHEQVLLILAWAAVAALEIGALMYPLARADLVQRVVLTVILGIPLVPVAEALANAVTAMFAAPPDANAPRGTVEDTVGWPVPPSLEEWLLLLPPLALALVFAFVLPTRLVARGQPALSIGAVLLFSLAA